VGLPDTFFESVLEFLHQPWDARVCGFSIARNNEILDGASGSPSLAAQCAKYTSSRIRDDSTPLKIVDLSLSGMA